MPTQSFPKFKSTPMYSLHMNDGEFDTVSYFKDKQSMMSFLEAAANSKTIKVLDEDEELVEIPTGDFQSDTWGEWEGVEYLYTIEQLYTLVNKRKLDN